MFRVMKRCKAHQAGNLGYGSCHNRHLVQTDRSLGLFKDLGFRELDLM